MQALADEFGPANPATREAVARLAAAREAPPPEWSELFAGVDDPRGELAALYDVAGPPDALLFAVHTHFARVARDVGEGRVACEPGTDVLRDLYQRLVPARVRGALGEFLTPPWLAEACVQRLEELGAPLTTGRVLDPTCGTGTFLLPILKRKLAAGGDVQAVLDSIAGYDLNPVALEAARANFAVALGERFHDGLRLPLYRADATRDAPAGAFDVIVGNPPWIGWRKLSARRREAGMATWKRYGLWQPPPENGRRPANPPMGDLATLVYASAVARHAAPGGHVGMLVPSALLIGDPGGRAFRRFEVDGRPFAPLHADLYDEAEPFAPDASNQPVFLVSRVDERAALSRPGRPLEPRARAGPAAAAGRSIATSRRRSGRSPPTAPSCSRAGRTAGASASACTRAGRTASTSSSVLGAPARRPGRDRQPAAGRARPGGRAPARTRRGRARLSAPARPRRLALARRARGPRLRALPRGRRWARR